MSYPLDPTPPKNPLRKPTDLGDWALAAFWLLCTGSMTIILWLLLKGVER